MSIALRLTLLVCSVLLVAVLVRKIRKAGLEIMDCIFWLLLAALLLVLAVSPGMAMWASDLLGFDSPSNFVFFAAIIVLLARTFSQDRKIAQLKRKVMALAQHQALHEAQESRETE